MYVCLSACLCHLFVCVYLFVCSRRHSQRRTILVIQPWPTRRQKPESTQWSHLICHCSHPLNAMLPESFLFSQWSQWFSQWSQWFSQWSQWFSQCSHFICHAMLQCCLRAFQFHHLSSTGVQMFDNTGASHVI